MMDDKILIHSKDICHHGVDGQRWGKRQYQYADGSLTPLGRVHYGVGEARERSKIKMREIKNETRNAVRLAKAQAKTAKAVAKAESQKLEAETKAYREKAEADNLVKLEKIRNEREKDRQQAKLAEQEAKNDAKLNAELAEATKENQIKESKYGAAAKTAIGILAAAGVGYLIYKACKSGETSAANREAAEKAIEKVKDKPVSEISNASSKVLKTESSVNPWVNGNKVTTDINKILGNNKANATQGMNFAKSYKPDININNIVKTKSFGIGKKVQGFTPDKNVKITKMSSSSPWTSGKSVKVNADKVFASNKSGYQYSKNPIKRLVEWGTGSKNQYNNIISKGFTPQEAFTMMGKKIPKYLRHSDDGMILIHSAPDVCHYGIKGQKKGYRRYQNEDGTLTEAGKDRYGVGDGKSSQQAYQKQQQLKGYNNTNGLSSKGRTKNVTGYSTGVTKKEPISDTKLNRSVKQSGKIKERVTDVSRRNYNYSEYVNDIKSSIKNNFKEYVETKGDVERRYTKMMSELNDIMRNVPDSYIMRFKDGKAMNKKEFAKMYLDALNSAYKKYKKNAKINGTEDKYRRYTKNIIK